MKNILLIIGIILISIIAVQSLEAQKKKAKKEVVKVDPEFEKFWKEFKVAYIQRDNIWFENNSLFPIVFVAEGGFVGFVQSKEEYLSDDWLKEKIDNKTKKKIENIKLIDAVLSKKTSEIFSYFTEDSSDGAKHIPNGSDQIEMGYQDGECYFAFMFTKINNKYYFFGTWSNCEGG